LKLNFFRRLRAAFQSFGIHTTRTLSRGAGAVSGRPIATAETLKSHAAGPISNPRLRQRRFPLKESLEPLEQPGASRNNSSATHEPEKCKKKIQPKNQFFFALSDRPEFFLWCLLFFDLRSSSSPQRLSSLSFFSSILPFFDFYRKKNLKKKPENPKKDKYLTSLLGSSYLSIYLVSTVRCVRLVWSNPFPPPLLPRLFVIASLASPILKPIPFLAVVTSRVLI
jgi:hypothetical protein